MMGATHMSHAEIKYLNSLQTYSTSLGNSAYPMSRSIFPKSAHIILYPCTLFACPDDWNCIDD